MKRLLFLFVALLAFSPGAFSSVSYEDEKEIVYYEDVGDNDLVCVKAEVKTELENAHPEKFLVKDYSKSWVYQKSSKSFLLVDHDNKVYDQVFKKNLKKDLRYERRTDSSSWVRLLQRLLLPSI